MKNKRNQGQNGSLWGKLIYFSFLVAMTGYASMAEAVYNLPSDRSVSWQGNVGVTGDIPTRTTICATLSPSGGDDATAIKNALSACPSGQVVLLNAGTFNISSEIDVPSNVTLRGAGMGSTVLHAASSFSAGYGVVGFNRSSSFGSSVSIASGATKGSTVITTSSAHGLSVGDVVLIDQLDNASANPPVTNVGTSGTCSWCGRTSGRSLAQEAKVSYINSSTQFTVEIPLYWNFDMTLTPQVVKINNMVSNAGLESLTIDNSIAQYARAGIINYASNSWFYNVEIVYSASKALYFAYSYRCTVRGCKLHDCATPLGPSSGYGVSLFGFGSANLIENNIIYQLSNAIIMEGALSGNVIAYNYLLAHTDTSENRQNEVFSTHGAHPMMNLLEGNYTIGGVSDDSIWGTSSHLTYYRNRIQLQPLSGHAYYSWDVFIYANNRYYSLLGNVLGSGAESILEYYNATIPSLISTAIYKLGYMNFTDLSPTNGDPAVYSALLRHGNWDSVTNGVVWDPNVSDKTLPLSLYLTSKPSWWGNTVWPPIGPDVPGYFTSIPAKDRFNNVPTTKRPSAPLLL